MSMIAHRHRRPKLQPQMKTRAPSTCSLMLSDSDNQIDVQFPRKRFVAKPGDTETDLRNPYLRDYVL